MNTLLKEHAMIHRLRTTCLLAGVGLAAALCAPAYAQNMPDAPKAGLNKIGHIIVIYLENRSFDNLYGTFPGANGIANAGAAATQVDANGAGLAATDGECRGAISR